MHFFISWRYPFLNLWVPYAMIWYAVIFAFHYVFYYMCYGFYRLKLFILAKLNMLDTQQEEFGTPADENQTKGEDLVL